MAALMEVSEFFTSMSALFEGFEARVRSVYSLFRSPRTAFVLVATPEEQVLETTATAGREMTAIALMQKEGQAGEAVRRAAAAGAQCGVAPGEAWGVVQQLQAQTGGLDTGLAAKRAAWRSM